MPGRHRLVRPHRARRILARSAMASALGVGLVLGAMPAADAAAPPSMVCSAGGQITITGNGDGTFDWLLTGAGTCAPAGRPAQIRQVTLAGQATTQGLGVCTDEALIPDFRMRIAATFLKLDPLTGPVTTIQAQFWQLPATTFPIVSPFTVTDVAGSTLGAGEFATHIFVQCPPGGQPTMQVNWVQSLV